MNTITQGVAISPVNMDDRKNLGIKPGDTVRVHQKIQDKGKTRIQIFEGVVLAHKHGSEAGATFTVRKVASGVGVEKIYPLYSPNIDKIEIVKRAKVRRAKLYFIREKVAREIKRQMLLMHRMSASTQSEAEAAQRVAVAEATALAEATKLAEVEAAAAVAAAEAQATAESVAAEAAAQAVEAEAAATTPDEVEVIEVVTKTTDSTPEAVEVVTEEKKD